MTNMLFVWCRHCRLCLRELKGNFGVQVSDCQSIRPVCLTDTPFCMCLVQLPVQCCAVVMASTPVDAASATVGGKALSATCHPTSASTSTVEGTAFALWVPASAILAIKAIIVRKVRIISSKKRHKKVYLVTYCYWQ